MKSKQKKRRATDKIQFFSIRKKLITIITIIVLLSMGSSSTLVLWLVWGDLQKAAEANIYESNERSAMEAEYTLEQTRSESILLMQALSGMETADIAAQNAVKLYFERNPHIAALFFAVPEKADESLINEHFFRLRDIESALADVYLKNNGAALRRAIAGETVLLNAASWFSTSTSFLAYFFPWRNGAGVILFSPSNLEVSFSYGINQSYLINDSGDILIHADYDLVRSGANVANQKFTQSIWNNPAGQEQVLDTDENGASFFVAFTKLNIGGCTVITRIEDKKVFEGIRATIKRNIFFTLGVLSISILIIWFFAKSISVPLRTLAAAARTIEGGDFEKVKLKSRGRDEIGLLTASFQRMCRALGIFGRFTNRQIAIKAMRSEIKPGGMPKHATIFFSDIRDFTAKSERFTRTFGDEASDRIVNWLNDYFTRMVECVEKTGGFVDKFIGDAVMAHWGAAYTSGSPQKDAFNCVKAALMMRKALYEMNNNRRSDDPENPPIRIGCGINTGIITAGQIGSDARMEYTVIGDPVNLASRTEALNKPLGTDILITEDTWRMVRRFFITEEMPAVTVKGKEKPVRIFAVVNFTGTNRGPRTLSDVRRILGIATPDISKVDVNAHEKKYKIGSNG